MTALSNTQRPTGINTLERHLAYDLLLLARLNPDLKTIESAGVATKIVEVVISIADDGTPRLIARVSLPLANTYSNNTTQPLYMNVNDVSNVVVPADWKQAGT